MKKVLMLPLLLVWAWALPITLAAEDKVQFKNAFDEPVEVLIRPESKKTWLQPIKIEREKTGEVALNFDGPCQIRIRAGGKTFDLGTYDLHKLTGESGKAEAGQPDTGASGKR